MKDFIKTTFATVLGLIIFSVVAFLLSVFIFVGMVTSSDTEVKVKPDSVFHLVLDGELAERAPDNPFSMFSSDLGGSTMGLDDVLSSIKKAKDDENIAGIYIEAGQLTASYASLEEIRNAISDFKDSGKFVVAYSDIYSQGLYYLASVADKVYMNPSGSLDWRGISAQTVFFKDLLDKVGVKMQIFKVGTYKSAVEPFMAMEMSDANREQVREYVGSVWASMLGEVSESRNIPVDSLDALADGGRLMVDADYCVAAGMVDSLSYKNDMTEVLAAMLGLDEDEEPEMLALSDMKNVKRAVPKDKSGNIVAVYYAEGDIVDDGETGIVSVKMIDDIKKLRKDDDVKAVVLRVNSPGGSAFGSEQIWKEIADLKAEKPVVVSMGDYAASGGYYISCNANYIFAQSMTLTGSIGIFGMMPDGKTLADRLGVAIETVNTNRYSDYGSVYRPMNDGEAALTQSSVADGYDLFLKRCAAGRMMSVADIDKIAQGRVWTGTMAKEIGLVDEIGGLDDAVDKAVELAGIESYTLLSYPGRKSVLDDFYSAFSYVKASPSLSLEGVVESFKDAYEGKVSLQARLPFYLELK